jgi:hypothetical protein
MRFFFGSTLVLTLLTLASAPFNAQGRQGAGAAAQPQEDADRVVANGGIFAAGWQGRIDAPAIKQGQTVNNARIEQKGNVLYVTTGPAIAYWNPSNMAAGNYTVRASFHEPEFMNRYDHAHPYGLFVAGNDLNTDTASYLYCAAYGDGRFIIRGFGPEPFQMNGRRGGAAPSVNRASGRGAPVTQDIAISVDANNVSCSINGTVVATYPKAEVLGAGKLKSTDGIYGVRYAHNTEGTVTGLAMTKN